MKGHLKEILRATKYIARICSTCLEYMYLLFLGKSEISERMLQNLDYVSSVCPSSEQG
jgi:hypothetical protein